MIVISGAVYGKRTYGSVRAKKTELIIPFSSYSMFVGHDTKPRD